MGYEVFDALSHFGAYYPDLYKMVAKTLIRRLAVNVFIAKAG